MTVTVSKSAINLRAMLAKLAGMQPSPERQTFDHEFDGSNPSVVLQKGWKPFAIYLNGQRQREGANNDYVAEFDGFVWIITFNVTPSNISVAVIDAEQNL